MQKRMPGISRWQMASIIVALCLLSLLLGFPFVKPAMEAHAYTAARRPSLRPQDIFVSRERILRSAKAHVDRANEVGYGYNSTLTGSEYRPLATSRRQFCCVDLVTHVLYAATASKINGQYHSIEETLATRHAFADSNGIVFNTSGVGILRQQLTAMPQLYTRLVAPVDKSQLRLGDIVISGERNSALSPASDGANRHATLVIGKVTPAENAYLKIPNYNPNTSYFITMSSSRGAEWVSTNQYDRNWNTSDPNKGYFISNVFRMRWEPSQRDYGGFRIKKADSETGAGLTGAEFTLRDPNGEMKKIVMTSSEYVTGLEYEPGTYTLTETKAPEGYRLDPTPRTLEIAMDEINSVYWNTPITNARVKGRIRILKNDSITNDMLQGAAFQLYDAEGNLVTFDTVVDGQAVTADRLITDDEGVAITPDVLPAGIYTLKEVQAPDGYASGEDVTFEITGNTEFVNIPGIGEVMDVEIGNAPTVVELSKKAITGDEELPGAHLCILEKEGDAFVEEWVSTDTPHIVRRLNVGETYILRETISPAGYTIANDVEFTVLDTGDVQPVEMRNDFTCVEIQKKDNSTGKALEGVEFQVFDKDEHVQQFVYDETLGAYVRDDRDDVDLSPDLITDDAGAIRIYGLPIGDYELIETKELPGYKRLLEPVSFIVNDKSDDTAPVVIELENELNDVKLGKTNRVTGAPVEGAVIQIFDEAGELTREVATDKKGRAELVGLPAGTYTFRETAAPEGYVLNEETFTFIMDSFGTVDGVTAFTNDPITPIAVKEDAPLPTVVTGEVFPLSFIPFFGLAVVLLSIALILGRRRKSAERVN